MATNTDFTPREFEILAKAWSCMDAAPTVNYNKLAALCGMSNPRSASNAWAKIKQKIEAKAGNDDGSNNTKASDSPAGTPKTTPAAKRRAKKDADGESPTKKTKSTGKGGAKSEVKSENEDAGGPEVKQEQGDDGEERDLFS